MMAYIKKEKEQLKRFNLWGINYTIIEEYKKFQLCYYVDDYTTKYAIFKRDKLQDSILSKGEIESIEDAKKEIKYWWDFNEEIKNLFKGK